MRRVYRRPYTQGVIGLYPAADVRAFDAAAIAGGVPGYELMQRAGAVSLRAMRARWSVARDPLVFCGGGNNGGDGYVFARLAKTAGLAPRVIAMVERSKLKADAARAADDCVAAGVPVLASEPREWTSWVARSDVIVDALLGIGLESDVRPEFAQLIDIINDGRRPVLALDVPSGLCADTGLVRGCAVRAQLTVTFIAGKCGLWLAQGPDHAGEIIVDDLGVGTRAAANSGRRARLQLLQREDLFGYLQPRARGAHKGDAGHVLIVGGGEGMPGAARLAGEAALRSGAGRVSVLCAPTSASAVAGGCAELMVRGIDPSDSINDFIDSVDALAIGPGLGRTSWGRAIFTAALHAAARRALPTVIDADALNLLAEERAAHSRTLTLLPPACVLTPHPGEAGRLLGSSSSAVQADRLAALRALAATHDATIVLKGAGSLISHSMPALCPYGNPAMAAPGMGDVLTGVIATLLAQGLAAPDAARAGVLWHALAGDLAAHGRDRGLLASDLAHALPVVLQR